jgi:hypothetical protein
MQRAAVVSTPLHPTGDPREKCDDRSKPHRSYYEREPTLRGHPSTLQRRIPVTTTGGAALGADC